MAGRGCCDLFPSRLSSLLNTINSATQYNATRLDQKTLRFTKMPDRTTTLRLHAPRHPRDKSHGYCCNSRKTPGHTCKNCADGLRRSPHVPLWRASSAASSGNGTLPRGCVGAMPLMQARWQTSPSISAATKKPYLLHCNSPGATAQSKAMFTRLKLIKCSMYGTAEPTSICYACVS